LSFRPARSLIDGSCASIHWASVDWRRSLDHTSLGVRLDQDRFQDRTGARQSTGRAPPRRLRLQLACASRIPNSLAESRIEATCVAPDV
jgi:hypothetical protein